MGKSKGKGRDVSDLGISRFPDSFGGFGTWTEVPDCLDDGIGLRSTG